MDKKVIVPVVFLLIVLGLYLASAYGIENSADSKDNLSISMGGPFTISEFINEIRTEDYFEGYDNETVAWLESLGNKEVFFGDGYYVLMSSSDAKKIPMEYATDVEINYFFDCSIVENRSLGCPDNPTDIILVKNVKYTGQEILDIPGGGA